MAPEHGVAYLRIRTERAVRTKARREEEVCVEECAVHSKSEAWKNRIIFS